MMKENNDYKEIKNSIEELLRMLEDNGWEINEDGDIVEKKSKKLVWNIMFGNDKDE